MHPFKVGHTLAKFKSYSNRFIFIAYFCAAARDASDYEYSTVTCSFLGLTYYKQESADKEYADYLNPDL